MLNRLSMTQEGGTTQSYILRIYPPVLGEEQTDCLRCALIDSHTGERQAFSGLTTLFRQLVEEVTQHELANSASQVYQE